MTDDEIVEAMARALEPETWRSLDNEAQCAFSLVGRDWYERMKMESLRKASAALSVARPMIEAQRWRSIESAPKDGSEFLAYDRVAKKFDACTMIKFSGDSWGCRQTQYDGEYGPFEWDFGYDWRNITHWMSLPSPPATGENENG